jgi:hypothetical protein
MTATEIKAAWNTFKKEAGKEISFDMTGTCYMNAKQIANGTATISLCNDIEYEDDIRYYRSSIERVNGYETWTAEEKEKHEAHEMKCIAACERGKAKYGTKANEAETKAAEILSSKAYKKLADAIGINNAGVEFVAKWAGLNVYQIRISY